jgi:hypothetical protein
MHFYSMICVLWHVMYDLRSLAEKKIYHLQEYSNSRDLKNVYLEIQFAVRVGSLYQRIRLLREICSYCATPISLVTNARICVALYPSNTQKRNTLLSVGIVACNAHTGI